MTTSTSATIAEAQEKMAKMATHLLGTKVKPERLIGETTSTVLRATAIRARRSSARAPRPRSPGRPAAVRPCPATLWSGWIETAFGLARVNAETA